MKRIGITGPTGAGKTTALQALVELDAHIIDADAVYHALLESSAPLRAALTVRFGPSILDGEGRVNRKALGGVVFGDPAALADLNAITHCDYLLENRADDTPEAFQARAKQLFEQILSNRN